MSTTIALSSAAFVNQYLNRLGLDVAELDAEPTLDKLQRLQEAHLARIPFENLSQHGASYPATVLSIDETREKILEHKRGGFCLELGALFALFLEQIGYTVNRVPSVVYDFKNEEFRSVPTHIILIVTCCHKSSKDSDSDIKSTTSTRHVVDVGFGEPALHPLDYDKFGIEQITPEGMKSRLVRGGGDDGGGDDDDDRVTLYWYKNQTWQPRLRWSYAQSLVGVEMSYFAEVLEAVLQPSSIFSQKTITVLLTRYEKQTLAGNRLKISGPPRFIHGSGDKDDDEEPPVVTRHLESNQEVRAVLEERFGIPLTAT